MGSYNSKQNWNSYLGDKLFARQSDSITKYKVTKMLWEFYRITQMIIHRIFRMNRVLRHKRDLDLIWNV